jgi:predicted Fe-Mo cluster-binding NifX family protein
MTPKELIVVPSDGDSGMSDSVSNIFAKAPYFTFVEVIDGRKDRVTVEENESSGLSQGTGPIVMKGFKDRGVDVVLASEVGPGARTLMDMSGIRLFKVEPGTKVSKAFKQYVDSQAMESWS